MDSPTRLYTYTQGTVTYPSRDAHESYEELRVTTDAAEILRKLLQRKQR